MKRVWSISLIILILIFFNILYTHPAQDNNTLSIPNESIPEKEESHLITAKEGFLIANNIAVRWSMFASLITVEFVHYSNSEFWYYDFIDTPIASNESKCLKIKLDIYGNVEFANDVTPAYCYLRKPITYWKLDSDELFEIAINDRVMQSYFFENATSLHQLQYYNLRIKEGTYDTFCNVRMTADGNNGYITLFANNGEVYYYRINLEMIYPLSP